MFLKFIDIFDFVYLGFKVPLDQHYGILVAVRYQVIFDLTNGAAWALIDIYNVILEHNY